MFFHSNINVIEKLVCLFLIFLYFQLKLADSSNHCKLCEYCGVQVSDLDSLEKHIERLHIGDYHEKGFKIPNITELTLNDVSNLGMIDNHSKTVFRVFEIPCKESVLECKEGISSNSDAENNEEFFTSKDEEEKQKNLDAENVTVKENLIHSTASDSSTANLSNVETALKESLEDKIKHISCDKENPASEESETDVTILCEPDDSSLSSLKGELVLTVESEAKVVSSEGISKGISSPGILRKMDPCKENHNVIIKKLSYSSVDSVKLDKSFNVNGDESEKDLQLYNNVDENQFTVEQNGSAKMESDRNDETYVVVNCVDRGGTFAPKKKGTVKDGFIFF